MNSPGEFFTHYHKLKDIIESSTNMEHILVSKKMLDSLMAKCLASQALPYTFFIMYMQNLKLILSLKEQELKD
jgi:hypothetical protein